MRSDDQANLEWQFNPLDWGQPIHRNYYQGQAWRVKNLTVCIKGVFFAPSISAQLNQTLGELGTKHVGKTKLVEV